MDKQKSTVCRFTRTVVNGVEEPCVHVTFHQMSVQYFCVKVQICRKKKKKTNLYKLNNGAF